jgi:hypothetical protein
VLLALAAFALCVGGSSCTQSSGGADVSRGPGEPAPSADVTALSALIRVPKGVLSARWWIRPIRPPGSRLVPGPTDAVLVAYIRLPPEAWSTLGPTLRPSRTAQRPITKSDAQALLPEALVTSLAPRGDKLELVGQELDPASLGSSLYHPIAALKVGDDIYATFRTQ